MKKNIIIITFLTCLLFFNTSYSEECNKNQNTCKIKDEPAKILLDYFSETRTVIKNITNGITKDKINSKLDRDKNRIQKSIIKGYNEITNWDGYFSKFEYYVFLPIRREVPKEVLRDHKLIVKEAKYLERYLEKIVLKGYSDIKIKKVCEGIKNKNNCFLDGQEAKDIIIKLIQNTEKIGELYRLSIADKKEEFEDSLILVDKNTFIPELTNYYNTFTLSECSICEGGFLHRVNEAIKQISENFGDGNKGIQERKDALALVRGIDRDKYLQREREVLIRELGRQGVSGDNSRVIVGNLDRYNENSSKKGNSLGYSLDNNFLTNTFSSFLKNTKSQVNDFNESVLQSYKKETDSGKVSLKELANIKNKITKSQDLKREISELYQKELIFAHLQDNSTQKLQARIIGMHYHLNQAINNLNEALINSRKICNTQDKGKGKCN